ncbi:FKBP-type peptidyl-prolyl cis-trans isomerase [Litoribacter alkaliphilus]|uniref:peptidylprolyl isomerase n=1 Tax=Litoribacter ruber TaxID=702568 RepID=A0AAP2CDX4_9BACT|nr:FKBP-type peptidyl-prolyl cis-trans isomerase [Litoribacter alkaliphilus]MBS9522466.1 FKBP-type peptidyl-prolyl cis-trans isomerase [Litoribacter alkaliphilus]
MNMILRTATAAVVALGMSACLSPMENEIDKVWERDDTLLKAYMESNNIEATKTQVGYYYSKEIENDNAPQITNNSIVGIYYRIKTIDGKVIDSHTAEDGDPLIFLHGEAGMVPRVINFASGLASEGEVLNIYAPSQLGYGEYQYQQLILASSNLDIRVEYAKVYTKEELAEIEDQRIQDYLASNSIEGFERQENGAYIKVYEEGDADSLRVKSGDRVVVNYKIYELSEKEPFGKGEAENGSFGYRVGVPDNLKFLDQSVLGFTTNSHVEIIAPSHLAYGASTQVIPQVIREDLFKRELIMDRVRPFEPIRFNTIIKKVERN